MEHLVENNYFESLAPSVEDEEGSSTSDMFKNINLVKTACLNFGRDRFDILRYDKQPAISFVFLFGFIVFEFYLFIYWTRCFLVSQVG